MPSQSAKHNKGMWLIFAGLITSALCFFSLAYVERAATQRGAEYVPVSLSSKQVAIYSADLRTIQIPAARLDLIADVIRDQEPDADAAARFATVQANLLTPVAWLISPTPSRTPTPTFTPTPTPSPSQTPTAADQWISLGYARVGCNTQVQFDTVAARKLKFQLLSGGGNDNHVSLYCCGSTGVSFWANNTWVHVTDQSNALNVGESRETGDLNAIVNRAYFNIGCNDKEPVQVQIFYIPAPTPITTTLTVANPLTRVATPTPSTTLSTQIATRSATPSATLVPQTQTPLATPTARSR